MHIIPLVILICFSSSPLVSSPQCQALFDARRLIDSGDRTGEAAETFWAFLGQIVSSFAYQSQSPGMELLASAVVMCNIRSIRRMVPLFKRMEARAQERYVFIFVIGVCG
jgi:hypothetical protein